MQLLTLHVIGQKKHSSEFRIIIIIAPDSPECFRRSSRILHIIYFFSQTIKVNLIHAVRIASHNSSEPPKVVINIKLSIQQIVTYEWYVHLVEKVRKLKSRLNKTKLMLSTYPMGFCVLQRKTKDFICYSY